MAQHIVNAVKSKIYGHGRGWVFTPQHFADLGSDTGVRTALSRLQKEKVIRRVAQGIYDYPRTHKTFGILSPSVDAIAKAFAEKNGAQIQASGGIPVPLGIARDEREEHRCAQRDEQHLEGQVAPRLWQPDEHCHDRCHGH